MALITCKNVSFAYEGHTVVQGLNFAVAAGDYLCVVGENGSGKSTLIKGLLHLKAPAGGTLETGDGLLPTQIGYLPQQTDTQRDFPAGVMEVVLSGRQNRKGWRPFYTKEDKAAAARNLARLDAGDLAGRCFRELSGGQRQRVLLARALCATGRLLLLDEPVAGLDPPATQELYHLIRALNREGLTVIMVSHDIRSAVDQASHILHLAGRQMFFGPAAAYAAGNLGSHYLGGMEDA